MSNLKTAERIFNEVWNKGKLELCSEIVAANAVNHDSNNPFPNEKGPEPMRKTISMYLEAFPNTTFTIRDSFESGDKCVVRWTAEGTHKGTLMGVAATGKDVNVSGISISRFENGKVVEVWENWDTLGMLQQIGVVPKMG